MLETVKAYSKKNLRKTFSHRFVEYMMDMQCLSIQYEFEYIRRHNNTLAITLLTIFLGWTFFGWLAALLWALNSDIKDKENDY